jgi:hypothetical protein
VVTDAQFVLTRTDLGATSEATVPVVRDASGTLIPSQLDDMDQDGKWDEWLLCTPWPLPKR